MPNSSIRPYGPGSNYSYFQDLAQYQLSMRDAKRARERLMRHADLQYATDEVRTVRAVENTQNRVDSENDYRSLSTSSNSDGVFVTPNYLVSEGDIYKSYGPSVLGQLTSVPDVGYGLTVDIPTLTSTTSVFQQVTENTGIADSVASGAYASAPIGTFAGEVPMSIQLYERSGPKPYTLDRIISLSLKDALNAELDSYALSQLISTGGITQGASSYSNSAFYEDVANTQATISTGAGTKLPADAAFTSPTLTQWLLSQADTNGRPLLTPALANTPSTAKLTASGNAPIGFTGTTLLGTSFFFDGNTPNVANTNPVQSQIVFANTGETFWMCSEPVTRIIPYGQQQGSSELTVLVQYFCYAALVVRHASAVQTLQAQYLLDSPTFT